MPPKLKKNDAKSKTKSKAKPKPKKVPKQKIYCGVGLIPTNHRIGNMKECADAGQVRYYGLNKIDKLVLKSSIKLSMDEEKDLYVKLAGLRGEQSKLARDVKTVKTEKEKNDIFDQYKLVKKRLESVTDKIDIITKKKEKLEEEQRKIKEENKANKAKTSKTKTSKTKNK